MKKTFWVALVIAMVSFMSMGCFTTLLWEGNASGATYQRSTEEQIDSFMMTPDGSKIVFVSKNYHYILNSIPSLAFLLVHKDELPVTYELAKGNYTITSNEVTHNYAQAVFNAQLDLSKCNPTIAKQIIDNNYGTLDTNKSIVSFRFVLGGTRYRSDPKINDRLIKLQTPVSITIREYEAPSQAGQTLKKIAMTPLAIAADGAVTAVFVGLTVVMMPVIIPVAILSHK